MKKVYCNNCLLLFNNSSYICNADENIKIIIREDNWFDEDKEIFYIRKPEEINKNNNCKWYKPNPVGMKYKNPGIKQS